MRKSLTMLVLGCVAAAAAGCATTPTALDRGIAHYRAGQYFFAADDFNEAIRQNPNSVSAYVNRGITRVRLGELNGAIEDYNKAVQLAPGDPEVYFARGNALVQRTGRWLAGTGISPNAISLLSIVFAALGAAALLRLPSPWGPWSCALAIVLRLLCNLFDGLVAVEHGRRTPTGMLYNEVPDRVGDSLFLVALGYAAGLPWCGWLAALLAALTAYIRVLGGTLGQASAFVVSPSLRNAASSLAHSPVHWPGAFAGMRCAMMCARSPSLRGGS